MPAKHVAPATRWLSTPACLQVMLEDGFALFGQFIKWMEAGVLSGNIGANTEEIIYLRDPVNPWVSHAPVLHQRHCLQCWKAGWTQAI